MIIIVLFLIGFVLGLGYAFIGERLPLLVPEIVPKEENSWIFNLFAVLSDRFAAVFFCPMAGFLLTAVPILRML